MEIKKQLIQRQIAGETILVPVGKTVYESKGLFVLNELGSFIWDILPQVQSKEEIVEAILNEYDVDKAIAEQDTEKFLQKLTDLGVI
ncbi:MAG: PqqD family protein [Clostridia bacterium]|nr:PqqD family protein [Clostridia bacterium]